jgi:hypothetical protein
MMDLKAVYVTRYGTVLRRGAFAVGCLELFGAKVLVLKKHWEFLTDTHASPTFNS